MKMQDKECCCVPEKELTEAIRLAIQDRATWFYLLLKEIKAAGGDPDAVAEKAIFKFGQAKGKKIGKAATPKEFFDGIATRNAALAFAMEPGEVTADRGYYRFHYCALVEAWKQLGCSPGEIAHLCELAKCGDYGVISCFPELELSFNGVIAEGKPYCELIVTKKKA
jgi:hypothetical protein